MTVENEILKEILENHNLDTGVSREYVRKVCEKHSSDNYYFIIAKLRLKGIEILDDYSNIKESALKTVSDSVNAKMPEKTKTANKSSANRKSDSKIEILDFHAHRNYDSVIPEYAALDGKVIVESNDWKEIYVGIMKELARSYHSKIASWCGFEDVYNTNKNFTAPKWAILEYISSSLVIDVNHTPDDIVGKIYKFLNVCNVDVSSVEIGITSSQTSSLASIEKPMERNYENENKYDFRKVIDFIISELKNEIAKQRELGSESIDEVDYEKAMIEFRSAWLNIRYLNTTLENVYTIANDVQTYIDNGCFKFESTFGSVNEIIAYFEVCLEEKKKWLQSQINNYSSEEANELIMFNFEFMTKLNKWIEQLKEFK